MPYNISGSVTFTPGGNTVINFSNSGNTIQNFVTNAGGDILYALAGSPSVLTRLAIGAANQVLTVNGGATAPIWATNPGTDVFGAMATYCAFVYPSATYGLTTGAPQYISWTTGPTGLHYTAGEGWSNPTTNSTWAAIYAGKYRIETQLEFSNVDNEGYRVLEIVYSLAGALTVISQTRCQPPSDESINFFPLRATAQPNVAAASTFGVRAYTLGTQTTGIISTSTWPQSYLEVSRVG